VALRITRKRLGAHNTQNSSTTPERTLPIKKTETNPELPPPLPPPPPKPTASTSREISTPSSSKKPRKHQPPPLRSFVESLGKDVLSERHLLSFNRIDKKALVFGATASIRASFPVLKATYTHRNHP